MANDYDSWNGIGEISKSALFETATRKPVDPKEAYIDELWEYLPQDPASSTGHFFIARVATKNVLKEDCLALFASGSWEPKLRNQLDAVHFKMIANDMDELQSNVDATIKAAHWKAEGRIFVFRNLSPPGIPTAKIVFRRTTDAFLVSAFWCWA